MTRRRTCWWHFSRLSPTATRLRKSSLTRVFRSGRDCPPLLCSRKRHAEQCPRGIGDGSGARSDQDLPHRRVERPAAAEKRCGEANRPQGGDTRRQAPCYSCRACGEEERKDREECSQREQGE